MRLKDLVVLQYAPNVAYVKVVGFQNAKISLGTDLNVNLKRGFWEYGNRKDIPIGMRRELDLFSKGGVIGVYDKTNTGHLNNMVHDTLYAISEPNRFDPDE